MVRQARRPKWSAQVTAHSDALDVRDRVFTSGNPDKIARSLKQSAEANHWRTSGPFRSVMSMLTLYINQAGQNLSQSQRKTLEETKDRIPVVFGRRKRSSARGNGARLPCAGRQARSLHGAT